MEKRTFVRTRMLATDQWQCYRYQYGGIHSILVPLGDKWEWRHMDGDWIEVRTFDGLEQADDFIKERYNVKMEIKL